MPRGPRDPGVNDQQWIPILDYAVLRGVSTSTLRRYIKAKKIEYKIENGRYLLLAQAQQPRSQPYQNTSGFREAHNWDAVGTAESVSLFHRVRELEQKLVRAQEQITELKMLVAIYEEKLP